MRILLPTIRDPGQIGGTSTHLDMLSRGLEAQGHEPRVLFMGGETPQILNQVGVVWTAGALNRLVRGWGMIYAAEIRARLLGRLVERELAAGNWDVINAQEVYSVPALRRVADYHGLPLVLTLHGYPLYESISEGYTKGSEFGCRYLMGVEMRALRLADAVVTVDSRLHRHVLGLVPERAETTHVLMNFLDTSVFSPGEDDKEGLRRKWGLPEGRIILFCPRRLVKKNGVVYPSLALTAMPSGERERFLLLHAGEGGERAAIERVVTEHGLGGEVRLLGGQGREAIRELYQLADVVLVPSVHSESVEEATSLAALEAMASGCPLIAGEVGGLAEMVTDGENGLLVHPADPEALAAAILRLAAEPQLAAALAERGRAYVVERHSHTRAASAYSAVYESCIRARKGVPAVQGRSGRGAASSRISVAPLRQVPPSASAVEKRVGESPPGARVADALDGEAAAFAAVRRPARALAFGPAEHPGQPLPGPGRVASSPAQVSILGFPLHLVSLEEAAAMTIAAAKRGASAVGGRTWTATSFNPELVIRAQRHPAVAQALLESDLRYPDGVGAVWAANRLGVRAITRVPGIELAEAVLVAAAAEGLSVYFLGGAEGVAEEAAHRQRSRLPGLLIAGVHHGYFPREDEASVVATVRQASPGVLLVALGAPRQELFVLRWRMEFGAGATLGVGGSFDVWAGRVRRAPSWARSMNMEWLYRLLREPRRLRRQLALPQFAYQVLAFCPDDYGPGRGAHA